MSQFFCVNLWVDELWSETVPADFLTAGQEDLQGHPPAAPRGSVESAARHSQNKRGEEGLLRGEPGRIASTFTANEKGF